MALLRLNPPGLPVRHIDLGHARGRVSPVHAGSLGGPLEYVPRKVYVQYRQPVEATPRTVLRCGAVMARGLICGRRQHDISTAHRSEANVAKDAARRRTQRGDL